jgi:hypothetical protein
MWSRDRTGGRAKLGVLAALDSGLARFRSRPGMTAVQGRYCAAASTGCWSIATCPG